MLAVVGGKGGVGKTTTALGIARALGARGGDPVVVDADRDAPDLAAAAGLDRPAPGVSDLADGATLESAGRRHPTWQGVTLLTAIRPSIDELRAALGRLGGRDRVVVDCPAGAGRSVAAPLRAADRSVVVSTPRPAAVRDAVKSAALAGELGAPAAWAAVTRCRSPGTTVRRAFDRPTACVPWSETPLTETAVQSAYEAQTDRFVSRNR
jgi:septum site-determining protein MinD